MIIGLAEPTLHPGRSFATYFSELISNWVMTIAGIKAIAAVVHKIMRIDRLRSQIAYVRSVRITSEIMMPHTINQVTTLNWLSQISGLLIENLSLRDRNVSTKGKYLLRRKRTVPTDQGDFQT